MIFYAECYNQRRVINILWGKINIRHLSGRGKFFSQIKEGKEKKKYLALLDEDPQTDSPTQKLLLKVGFELVEEKEGIKLFKDKDKNLVITLSPDLEEWIYNVAKKEGIKLSDFGFSDNPESFPDEAKVSPSKFQQLIHNLLNKKNKELRYLKGLLIEI
ncbi:MAG: hypothetical protein ABIK40_01290 [candidate division WOR-3 bacterium]